jgi:hypothetical protein
MVLMPGTYEVRLVETASELNVVEILDSNGVHLLTMEMTIPVERPEEPAGIRQSLLKSEFPEHPRQSRIGSTPGIRTAMSSFTRTRVPT